MGNTRQVIFLMLKVAAGMAILFVLAIGALAFYMGTRQREFASMTDSRDLAERVQQLGNRYAVKRPKAALAIGVLQRGKTHFVGVGKISESNTSAPNARTVFEIGSITKVFTATVLAQMNIEQKFKLDDPVQSLLPANVKVPTKDDEVITLKHLATHSSGLPRLPDNLFKVAKDQSNPYANYSASNLYVYLNTAKLNSVPGKKASYSNLGVGLLGHALSLRAGKPYEQLIKETVCQPLAMNDTTITLSDDQKNRLAPGHDTSGKVVPNWDFDVLAPAGALRSTVDDMLKFLAANLQTNSAVLSRALQETHRRHFQNWTGDCGLAWQIMKTAEGITIRWHNGGTGGYVSFMGFDRQHQTGVIVLSSSGDAMAGDNSIDKMGVEILKLASKISL